MSGILCHLSTKDLLRNLGQLVKFFLFPKKDLLANLDNWSIFADSVQTEYCPTFHLSVCLSVTGVTSHISHIYKGINAMLIIRDTSTTIYSESKSFWLSF